MSRKMLHLCNTHKMNASSSLVAFPSPSSPSSASFLADWQLVIYLMSPHSPPPPQEIVQS